MTKSGRKFSVDDRITHAVYGTGTIAAIDPNTTVIDFDKNGRRKFVTSMVELEPTDVAAPVKPAPKSRARKKA